LGRSGYLALDSNLATFEFSATQTPTPAGTGGGQPNTGGAIQTSFSKTPRNDAVGGNTTQGVSKTPRTMSAARRPRQHARAGMLATLPAPSIDE